jgi:hypothetical protein
LGQRTGTGRLAMANTRKTVERKNMETSVILKEKKVLKSVMYFYL